MKSLLSYSSKRDHPRHLVAARSGQAVRRAKTTSAPLGLRSIGVSRPHPFGERALLVCRAVRRRTLPKRAVLDSNGQIVFTLCKRPGTHPRWRCSSPHRGLQTAATPPGGGRRAGTFLVPARREIEPARRSFGRSSHARREAPPQTVGRAAPRGQENASVDARFGCGAPHQKADWLFAYRCSGFSGRGAIKSEGNLG